MFLAILQINKWKTFYLLLPESNATLGRLHTSYTSEHLADDVTQWIEDDVVPIDLHHFISNYQTLWKEKNIILINSKQINNDNNEVNTYIDSNSTTTKFSRVSSLMEKKLIQLTTKLLSTRVCRYWRVWWSRSVSDTFWTAGGWNLFFMIWNFAKSWTI